MTNRLTFLNHSFKQTILSLILLSIIACGDEADSQNINTDDKGKVCGGLIVNNNCPENQFCKYEGNCGEADQTGHCTDKPEICAEIYAPVCGCDDKTYGNECEANSQGVSARIQGECK